MRPIFCSLFVLSFLCSLSLAQSATAPSQATPNKAAIVPLTVSIPTAPTAFRGEQWHLCYEIYISNLSSTPWSVQQIEVLNQAGASLRSFQSTGLQTMLFHPGKPRDGQPKPATDIAPGELVIAYMWIDLPKVVPVPTGLTHKISVKLATGDSAGEIDAPTTKVLSELPEILPPLHGKNWVAANGPSNTSQHRRALIVVDGTPHIAQRYAIDWLQIGDDGKTYQGDSKDNHSYHCFGVEAHAIADATVVEVKDGIPENTPNEKPAVPINFETVAGNHVNLDLGGGVYAMYAHLQPGSIRVKVGDKVTPGQVIGLVGNTGNSSEPHLHFQLMNRNSPLGSEGLPYALTSYQLSGRLGGDENKPMVERRPTPATVRGEIPMEDEVVDFEP